MSARYLHTAEPSSRDLHINVIVYSRQSVDCMRIFHDDDVYYTSVRGGGA
jgi:hypothetical protein